jgi:hypothetical protein
MLRIRKLHGHKMKAKIGDVKARSADLAKEILDAGEHHQIQRRLSLSQAATRGDELAATLRDLAGRSNHVEADFPSST